MNRNILFGLILLFLLSAVLSFKFYLKNKNETLKEYNNFLYIQKRIKEINYLKSKYRLNVNFLKECSVKHLPTKYVLKCENLDKKSFLKVERVLKKSKIWKFETVKDKEKVNVFLEIIK